MRQNHRENSRKLLRGSRPAATILSVAIRLVSRAIAVRIIICASVVIRVVHEYAKYSSEGKCRPTILINKYNLEDFWFGCNGCSARSNSLLMQKIHAFFKVQTLLLINLGAHI